MLASITSGIKNLPENERGQKFEIYMRLVADILRNKSKDKPFFKPGDKVLFELGIFTVYVVPGVIRSFDGYWFPSDGKLSDKLYTIEDASIIPFPFKAHPSRQNGRRYFEFRETWMIPADGSVCKYVDEAFFEELRKTNWQEKISKCKVFSMSHDGKAIEHEKEFLFFF